MGILFASAGGGGGGGGGGCEGDVFGLVFELLFYILMELPFPWNILSILTLILIVWIIGKMTKTQSPLNAVPQFKSIDGQADRIPPDFLHRNPGFDVGQFRRKVETAFHAIQQAWMNQDLRAVRRWISDGVWQRFHTQFTMMQVLGQKNTMSDIRVLKMVVDRVTRDGNYDIIDVGIHFRMQDHFVTEKCSALSHGGPLENVEYWTFLRKCGAQEGDLYHSNSCPGCAGPLPADMGEVGRCASCGAVTTLGEYDWVLSEITQANDYADESRKPPYRAEPGGDADFCVQLAEDKASNAYMQILSAQVTRRPERMRRFVSNELFDTLSARVESESPHAFNRLFLNHVTLTDYYIADGKDHLVFHLQRTSQRVGIEDGKPTPTDAAAHTTNEILILSRDTGAARPKGSLYSHSCSSCGGAVEDTLDLRCRFCGNDLNSTRSEWIVTRLGPPGEYQRGGAARKPEELFKVRDFAFNNVVMILGADGAITPQETEFGRALAKRLGYDPGKVAGMFDLAQKLTVRLPENRREAEKVLRVMEQAAKSDGVMGPREQAILDDVRGKIGKMAA